jgi:hypothetical protein
MKDAARGVVLRMRRVRWALGTVVPCLLQQRLRRCGRSPTVHGVHGVSDVALRDGVAEARLRLPRFSISEDLLLGVGSGPTATGSCMPSSGTRSSRRAVRNTSLFRFGTRGTRSTSVAVALWARLATVIAA